MDDKSFQKIAKALADPQRFKIFQMITTHYENGVHSGLVCNKFEISQPTISHHLKELTAAGLLISRTEGQFKFWKVNREIMKEYISELQQRLQL